MNYNFKKIICIMICGIMMTLCLSACNKQTEKTEKEEATQTSQPKIETIEEQVLFDENGVKVTAVDIVETENYGKGMVFRCENNTMQAVIFNCKKYLVNDISTPDLFGDQVLPGETLDITGYFGSGLYDYLDIDNVGKVTVLFDCFIPTETDSKSIYTSEEIDIKTSAYENMDIEHSFDGEEMFSDYGLTFYGNISKDDVLQNAACLLVVNESDSEFILKGEGATVNGTYNEGLIVETINANSTRFIFYDYSDEGAADLESFEIEYEVYDRGKAAIIGETGAIKINK